MTKLSLKDKIMAFMQRESYAPMTAEEMIFAIPVKEEPMHEFWDAITELKRTATSSRHVLRLTGCRKRWGW